jgi:glucose/arabinose dehydrogenase
VTLLLLFLTLEPIVSGLDHPVQIVSARDGSTRLYVAQQNGEVLVIENNRMQIERRLDLRQLVDCCANGGLLSIAADPHDPAKLYALYVDHHGDTVAARFTGSDPGSQQILFVVDQPADNLPNHHGGTLAFGPDGALWASIGDGGASVTVTNRAQEPGHFLGKLLRIDTTTGATEIWARGLRNPWRFSFDRLSGELFLADVGQDAWEEVNILTIDAAHDANFGWPMTEGRHCFPPGTACDTSGVTLPRLEYPRDLGCSVTGGHRYRGQRWPSLFGTYFYGDWCTGRIWGATERDGIWTSRELADTNAAIVSFGEDDGGELFVVDYNGTIYRLGDGPPAPRQRAVRH